MSSERVVLITGCSSGIGLSTAVLLAKQQESKFKVYASMRNLAKKDNLITNAGDWLNKTLFTSQVDVCSESSVNEAVKEILDKEGRIDVLINNAGMGLAGALEYHSMEKITDVFEVNVFGAIRTIRAVLPSMKARTSGQIINIGSLGGLVGVPFNGVYSSSKFALEGLTESLAIELAKFNIKVSIIEPGPVATSSFGDSIAAKGFDGLQDGDDATKGLMLKMLTQINGLMSSDRVQTSDQIAECILDALKAKQPHFRYLTNKAFEEEVKMKQADLVGDLTVKNTLQHYFGTTN